MFEKQNFTDVLKEDISNNISKDCSVNFLSYSVNHNYTVIIEQQKYFCRIYRPHKESRKSIEAEFDFINFLNQNSVKAAAPVGFSSNDIIREVKLSNNVYHYAFFNFIEGDIVLKDKWDLHFINLWGKTLGKFHACSKKYRSPSAQDRRPWNELEWSSVTQLVKNISNLTTDQKTILLKEWEQSIYFFNQLPTSEDYFGLVHYDFHTGNLIKTNSDLIIIDFDDCCRHWFGWDFAMPLHRLSNGHMSNTNLELKNEFIKAYKAETSLPEEIEKNLKVFERIRHLFMLSWLSMRKNEDKWKNIFPNYLKFHIKYLEAFPKLLV